MANAGNLFRDTIVQYINSWGENLEVLKEVYVGSRFIGTPRKLDVVIRNADNNKVVAIECKVQLSAGTAFEKLSYALDDCAASPIPTILCFAGKYIKDDMKSKLIMSGLGLEVVFDADDEGNVTEFRDPNNLLRQRCYIELGLNWFPFASGDHIADQLRALGYEV